MTSFQKLKENILYAGIHALKKELKHIEKKRLKLLIQAHEMEAEVYQLGGIKSQIQRCNVSELGCTMALSLLIGEIEKGKESNLKEGK